MKNKEEFIVESKKKWKASDESGLTDIDRLRQEKPIPKMDDDMIGKRIKYCSLFDMDEKGKEKELRWCGGVIERISDGTWVIPTVSGRERNVTRRVLQRRYSGIQFLVQI